MKRKAKGVKPRRRLNVGAGGCIGPTVRDTRIARGLTQRELAKRLGMTVVQLCKIERVVTYSPSVATLERLAEALDVPARNLLEGKVPGAKRKAPPVFDMDVPEASPEHVFVREGDGFELLKPAARKAVLAAEGDWNRLLAKNHLVSDVQLPLKSSLALSESGSAALARIFRAALGAGTAPFADLAGMLEFANVRIHLAAPKNRVFQSMAFTDPDGKVLSIVLNAADSPERHVYRLAYELGFAAEFASRGCRPLQDRPVYHRFARLFAAAFLTPEEAIRAAVAQTGIGPDDWTMKSLCLMKARFGISAEAFALRLEDFGLVTAERRMKLRDRLRDRYAAHPKSMEPEPRLLPIQPGGRLALVNG